MTCQFPAPETVYFAEFGGCEGTAYAPGVDIGIVFRLQFFRNGKAGADFLEHAGVLLSPFVAEIAGHEGNHKVRGHKAGAVVYKHHAVCVAVVDYADIGLGGCHKRFQGLYVLGHQGIGLVVGEAAVHGVEEEFGIFSGVDFLCKEAGHAV